MRDVANFRAARRHAVRLVVALLVLGACAAPLEGGTLQRTPHLDRDTSVTVGGYVGQAFVSSVVIGMRPQLEGATNDANPALDAGQTLAAASDSEDNWDLLRIWLAVSAMLVILMQLGFVFLEMGSVQERHRGGIAVKNFMMLLCSFLAYYLVGYHFMFGVDHLHGFIGWGWSYPPTMPDGLPLAYEWLLFQAGFAAVAATIISGALACRTTLLSNVVIAIVICAIIYPVFGHWVWGGGLFSEYGVIEVHDYAGSAVVHFLGGFSALVAAWIAGPRKEFPATPPDRSLPYATIGVIFLWVGWIGFNGGSATQEMISKDGYQQVGNAIVTTCMAACAGGLTAMTVAAYYHFRSGRAKGSPSIWLAFRQRLLFDPFATLSGAMGGMVAVTANCDWLTGDYHYVALSVGVCGGLATFFTAWLVRDILKVDDPVEAIAVHAGGGAMGVMIAGFHGTFTAQFIALLSCIMLVMIVLCPPLLLLRQLGLLRCSEAEEAVGLTFEQGFGPTIITRYDKHGGASGGDKK